jgi:hypothetical protein
VRRTAPSLLSDGCPAQIGNAIRERAHDHAWEGERATMVRTLLDEQDEAAAAASAEEARAAEAAAAAAAVLEAACVAQARAAAHAEALRSLSACLPAGSSRHTPANCLACLG